MIIDGVKQCELCGKKKYTIEFANDEHFEDKKVPVCIKCYKSKDGGANAIVHNYGFTKECNVCGLDLTLAGYAIVGIRAQNTLPHLSKKCRECSQFDHAALKRG